MNMTDTTVEPSELVRLLYQDWQAQVDAATRARERFEKQARSFVQKRKLSKADVARAIGVSRQAVGEWL